MSARRFWLAAALSLLALPAWAQKANIILVYRPDVELTSPTNGDHFVVGQTVILGAAAQSYNGSIDHVDFLIDGAVVATDYQDFASGTWTATLGTHTVAAKAVDSINLQRTTPNITIMVTANTPPTVSLTAPANGASYTVGATFAMTATASDSDGTITKVEFYVDSAKVGQATNSPYTYNWTGTAGDHSVYAKATDNATGSTSTSSITIHGKPAVPTLTLPSTSTTGSYTASWTTSTGTTHYEFSEQIGSGSWIPVQDNGTTSWNASGKTDGSYSYKVRACAGSGTGNCSAYSSTKTITVTLPNVPPSVSLTAPSSGANYTVGATVALTATASDSDGTVTKVEFYVDSAKVGQATSSPYTYNWTATAGDHSVYAKATDDDNASTSTSPPITIHGKPAAPTLTLPSTSSTGSYTATWTTSSGATHYELSEQIGSGSWTSVQNANTTSWSASGKTTGSYSYRVRACPGSLTDMSNCGSYSSTKTITVTIVVAPPGPPTLTVPSTSSTGSYSATWTTSSGATHYELSEQVGSGSWTSIQNASATSWSASGKTTGSYSYRVRACTGGLTDMSNCGSYSSTKTIAVTLSPPSITRTYTYNSYQELCRVVEPEVGPSGSTEGGATLMGYDGAGNLTWSASGLAATTACSSDGSGVSRKVTRTYDTRNRVSTLVFPDLNGNQSWTYTADGLPDTVTTYNDAGVNSVANSYTYNHRRLLTGEQQVSGSNTWTVGYGYDANAHLSTLAYPDSLTVAYAPNALGQPTQAGSYATNVTYYPNGAIAGFTYGNGIVHSLTQNARGLPDRSRDADGSTSIHDDSYFYDEVGNVAAIADGVSGARGDRDMTYDALNRLTLVTGAGGAASPMFGTASYTYDAVDNLRHVHVTAGSQPRDQEYFYDAHNRLTNLIEDGESVIGLDYDVQGNLYNKNGTTYTFDYGNRLRAGGPETYRYDVQGRRIRSSSTAGVIYSLYAQSGQLLFQRDERSSKRRQYIYLGGSLVAESDLPLSGGTATVTYQHTDALGSPVAVTDQSRTVIERTEYEPYGKVLNRPLHDGPGYTGHVEDAATGLVYMQARYCDPTIGRCLSVDPVTAYDNGDMRYFNRYAYAFNSPYSFTDPDGRCPTCDRFSDNYAQAVKQGRQGEFNAFVIPAAIVVAVLAAPVVAEVGTAALANPGTANAIASGIIEAGAGEALGGASLAAGAGAAASKLKPGAFAAESIPARSASQTFTSGERAAVNEIGQATGCHSCGTTNPGTKSGNFVPDHQPVSSLNTANAPQRLYPQCLTCSRQQGLEAAKELRNKDK